MASEDCGWTGTDVSSELIRELGGQDGVHFENEKWALQQCETRGIPAARFLHVEHGLPGYPDRSVIVNSYVEGEPLKQLMAAGSFEDSLESILPEVGRLLGYLHQVEVSGFGRLDGNGNGPF